jgi:hypothetical protein
MPPTPSPAAGAAAAVESPLAAWRPDALGSPMPCGGSGVLTRCTLSPACSRRAPRGRSPPRSPGTGCLRAGRGCLTRFDRLERRERLHWGRARASAMAWLCAWRARGSCPLRGPRLPAAPAARRPHTRRQRHQLARLLVLPQPDALLLGVTGDALGLQLLARLAEALAGRGEGAGAGGCSRGVARRAAAVCAPDARCRDAPPPRLTCCSA